MKKFLFGLFATIGLFALPAFADIEVSVIHEAPHFQMEVAAVPPIIYEEIDVVPDIQAPLLDFSENALPTEIPAMLALLQSFEDCEVVVSSACTIAGA